MGSMPSEKWRESKKAWTISLEASREQPQTFSRERGEKNERAF
jgi:hypothetical protein